MPSKREAMTARALSLVGCGYIYGATGWICTPSRLAQQEKQYPAFAAQMERYGKKWMGKPCYDCAQLTRDVARQAGVMLPSGATSQWRAAGIWKEKDVIDTLPDEAGIFLFTMRDGRMTHTGVSVGNGEEVDARGHAYGVVKRKISGTAYTHWARLAIDYDAPIESENPVPEPTKPTLRMGSRGEEVRALQEELRQLGFLSGAADGVFGADTRVAVMNFQKAHGLAADGIVGAGTWASLDAAMPKDEEEPSTLTRLSLTGTAMFALIEALNQPEETEEGMRFTLSRADYGELMRQIRLEAGM